MIEWVCQAPVVEARAGFLVTLVDQQMVERDLVDDEAVGVGADVEGGGRAIVVNRIGPEAH